MTDKTKEQINQVEAWVKRIMMGVCSFFFIMLVNDVKDIKEAQIRMLVNEAIYKGQIDVNTANIKKLFEEVKENTEHRIKTEVEGD